MATPMFQLARLAAIAQHRYAAEAFDDEWVARIHLLVSAEWPSANAARAELLTTIMAATPYAEWMQEFLIPARKGRLRHADILLRRFDVIAAAGAEGIARDDGLTRRA